MGYFRKVSTGKVILKNRGEKVISKCVVCGKKTTYPKHTKKYFKELEDAGNLRKRYKGHSVLVCSVACDSQRNQKIAVDAFSLPEDANKEAKKILAVVREAARRKKDSAILSLSDDQILRRIKKKRIWGEKIEAPSRNTFGRRKSTR